MSIILAFLFLGLGVLFIGTIVSLFTVWISQLVIIIIIAAIILCIFVCERPRDWLIIGIGALILIFLVLKIHDIIWIF